MVIIINIIMTVISCHTIHIYMVVRRIYIYIYIEREREREREIMIAALRSDLWRPV